MLGTLLVSASGAERSARARAGAVVATTSAGEQYPVAARGAGGEERRTGPIDGADLRVGSAEALARTAISGGKASARSYAQSRAASTSSTVSSPPTACAAGPRRRAR
jgi:hypothetical protein